MGGAANVRMRRYARLSALQAIVVLAVVSGALGPAAGIVLVVVSLPLVLAWGSFQADLTMNPAMDEATRSRWRIALWMIPGSMALYWYRYVRVREF